MGLDDEKIYSGKESPMIKFLNFVWDAFEKPVVWFRETIVEPNREEYYWYHRKYPRVPTVDQCYTDDDVCIYEADKQWERDKKVDNNIVRILRKRFENCTLEYINERHKCNELEEYYQKAMDNFFIKYGDLGYYNKSFGCYMKQKHRMAWERRHGPVGTGKKVQETHTVDSENDNFMRECK